MPTLSPMPPALVWLLAVACGLSVANVYYAHPLLDAIAADLGIGRAAVGGVITLTQAGSALALLVLRHRVLPRDPLELEGEEASDALLPRLLEEGPLSLDDALTLLPH